MQAAEDGTAAAGGAHLVEDVVVPLRAALPHHARLLQQVGPQVRPAQTAARVEAELEELPEPTRVVVADRLRIPESLKAGE